MNILLLSVGQRGYLVDHFRGSMGAGDLIFGADATQYAPALSRVDRAFRIPPATVPEYGDKLKQLCMENDVDGIISINDLELPVLAGLREEFAALGVQIVVSTPEVVELAFDKYLTVQRLKSAGIGVPATYRVDEVDRLIDDLHSGALAYPIISKPRRGSRSKGIYLVHSSGELRDDARRVASSPLPPEQWNMYQEYIDSDQYSLHVFNDWDRRVVKVVGMVNLVSHMSGETYHIRANGESDLLDLGFALGRAIGHFGPLCADVHKRGDEYVILEVNPRFGGGYSLSHFAGADFTGKVLQMIRREAIDDTHAREFDHDVVMLKQFYVEATDLRAIEARCQDYS